MENKENLWFACHPIKIETKKKFGACIGGEEGCGFPREKHALIGN
jgi:hypothetical protein